MTRIRTVASIALAAAALVGGILASSAPEMGAQQGDPPALTINQLDWSSYPELRAVVTVLDPDGLPVPGLTAAQFQALDAGQELQVLGATDAQNLDTQLDVIVTIDVSGSMAGAPMESAKAAATEFIQSLGPNDRAGLVSFSNEVTPVVPLTSDKNALTAAIAGLQPSGATALFQAVQVSTFLAGAAAAEGTRAAVVFLSDGENEAPESQATAESSLQIAQGSGIPVYPIALGALPDLAYLQQLAQATQGAYRAATPGTIGAVYGELSTLLRSQYIVTVQAKEPINGTEAQLQLVAFVNESPAASVATFQRGTLAPPPPSGAPDAVPGTDGDTSSNGGSGIADLALYGVGGLVALALLAVAVFLFLRFRQSRRILAHQLAVVAPNQRLAAEQGVPRAVGSYVAAEQAAAAAIDEAAGTGRLVERGGEGRVIEIGAGPVVIGSSARVCNVLIHNGGSIAPEHARIWLRGKRYVLHHVGGLSRKTYVAGHEADWVVLDDGDEITIGKWRFHFEDPETAHQP